MVVDEPVPMEVEEEITIESVHIQVRQVWGCLAPLLAALYC